MAWDRRSAWVLLAVTGLVFAGCVGTGEDPDDEGSPGAPDDGPTGASDEIQPRIRATSSIEVSVLGLSVFSDLDRQAVEDAVPEPFEPVPCFGGSNQTLDGALIITEETHPGLAADGDEPARLVSLLTCAERPEALSQPDANEPPWFELAGWIDGEAYRTWLGQATEGPPPAASIDIQDQDAGFTFEATDPEGTLIARGAFATPGVGLPDNPLEGDCTTTRQVGRVVEVWTNGTITSLDWVKQEALCLAEASVTWDPASPLATYLGPTQPDLASYESVVEEGTYTWRVLGRT